MIITEVSYAIFVILSSERTLYIFFRNDHKRVFVILKTPYHCIIILSFGSEGEEFPSGVASSSVQLIFECCHYNIAITTSFLFQLVYVLPYAVSLWCKVVRA